MLFCQKCKQRLEANKTFIVKSLTRQVLLYDADCVFAGSDIIKLSTEAFRIFDKIYGESNTGFLKQSHL